MTKQLQVWKFILDNLKQDIPVVLLYVVESIGSSPGRQGFLMAVNEGHIMKGSIGGGMMEHKFVELAKDKLREEHAHTAKAKRQVHDPDAKKHRSGMICSGEQTVVVYHMQPHDVHPVEQLVDCLQKFQRGKLVLRPDGIGFETNTPGQPFRFEKSSEEEWIYEEATSVQPRVHIIGGGHCALALSRIMRMLDFYVVVYDERPELNTMLQNQAAHEKYTVGSYEELATAIPTDDEAYVVIMTFGYRTDDVAMRALLHHRFKYLGLLGSKNKIDKMFRDYRAEGWSEDKIAAIHAPVGIAIKSETPEEIAVSIAAEIIKVKNNADQDRKNDI